VVRLAAPQRHIAHTTQSNNVIVLDLTQEQLQQSNLASMIPQGHVVISNNATKSHVISQPGHVMSQPAHGMSQPGHVMSQPGHVIISEGHNVTRKSGHVVISDGSSRNISESGATNLSVARKMFTHSTSASNSTSSRDQDMWTRMGLRMDSEDGDGAKFGPIPGESNQGRDLNMTPPSNYSDIFSAALEQANISLDSTNLIVEPASSHSSITTLAGRSATSTSGSRFVTLPHRPAYSSKPDQPIAYSSKPHQQTPQPALSKPNSNASLINQVPLYGPPDVVMPRVITPVNIPEMEGEQNNDTQQQGSFSVMQATGQAETLEDISDFLANSSNPNTTTNN